MSSESILLLALGLWALFSTLSAWLILPVLSPLLVEQCGNGVRAAFWHRFTLLMLFLAPLLMTAMTGDMGESHSIIHVLRVILRNSTLGILMALVGIGWAVVTVSRSQNSAQRRADQQSGESPSCAS
ncbi:hypothetical protein [Magnetofaba australis]|uniref:Transmembrane protein n=1 Tax=Magnetofaba australis IT-1 TaxID=1434232 RepID=A0A1Y2K7E6_9PROT|nr:hypothetical protein [Magnetofaba australis]OSM06249.1 hypothetical protein MAIT1_01234 [Magnetofaba australis IT-1]